MVIMLMMMMTIWCGNDDRLVSHHSQQKLSWKQDLRKYLRKNNRPARENRILLVGFYLPVFLWLLTEKPQNFMIQKSFLKLIHVLTAGLTEQTNMFVCFYSRMYASTQYGMDLKQYVRT